jgi:carotenoid cleavage dioxygenase-like enzyme
MSEFSRRTFVSGSGVSVLLAAHTGLAKAATGGITEERKIMRETFAAFQKARPNNPWTQGLINAPAQRLETPAARLEGKWPEDLKGQFFRTGPALHERRGERYSHWFDGDGMAQRYDLGEGKVSHLGRMIETPKYREEEKAGRFLRPAFGTAVDLKASVTSADDINVANINMLPLGDEVLALWEGGSAVALDAASLETRGFKVWSAQTKGLPFSAHHKVDPDGTIWNFGTANSVGRLVLYQVSPRGKLLKVAAHKLDPNGMVHDFIITEKHLVVIVPPFRRKQGGTIFVDTFEWQAGEPSVGLVFDKETLSLQRRFELVGDFHFHFGNAWEEPDGTLRFDYCATPDASFASQGARQIMKGSYIEGEDPATNHYSVKVPLKGEAKRALLGGNAEFPRIDPRLVGQRNRFIYSMWQPDDANVPFFQGLAQVDLTLGQRTTFDYGRGTIAEEHVFVPRPGGVDDQDGWVLGTTLSLSQGTTTLNAFDAKNLSQGPIARAHLDYGLPMGLHGVFSARA